MSDYTYEYNLECEIAHLGPKLLDGSVTFAADLRLRPLEQCLGVRTCLRAHLLSLDGGVTVGATYAGQYAYVADGKNGLKVVRLIDTGTPGYLGWSPAPVPELVAWIPTRGPAVGIAEGYMRDRPNDESGNQIGISNRLGARPFNASELTRFYLRNNELFTVENSTPRLKR